MKIIFLAFVFCVSVTCRGQQVVSSAGGRTVSQDANVSWSIGEPIRGSISDKNVNVTLGFQQGNIRTITSLALGQPTQFEIFPNPAKRFLMVTLRTDRKHETSIFVYSNSGSVVIKSSIAIHENKIELDVSQLTAGIYQIIVKEQGAVSNAKSFIKF